MTATAVDCNIDINNNCLWYCQTCTVEVTGLDPWPMAMPPSCNNSGLVKGDNAVSWEDNHVAGGNGNPAD